SVVRGHDRVRALALRSEIRRCGVVQSTSRSPISLIAFPTLALSTLSTASTDGRWCCSTSTPPHASCPSCSTVSDKRLPNRFTLLSTPSPGCTIMGPIWTSNGGAHTCVTAPPYVVVMSRSFIGLLLCWLSQRKKAGHNGLRVSPEGMHPRMTPGTLASPTPPVRADHPVPLGQQHRAN